MFTSPPPTVLRIAFITTDNREDTRDYSPEKPWFGTAPQALLDGFANFPDDIEIHVLSCARKRLASPINLAPNIFFHSVYVPAWAWLKTLYLGNIIAVRRCLKKIKPDLVHGQGTERDCAWCAVFSGYPNLITIHGNMRRLAKLSRASLWSFIRITAALEHIAIRLCGGVICISNHTKNTVCNLAKRTWVIPNAVNLHFIRNGLRTNHFTPIILMIGDLIPNKNQLAFLNAIESIQTQYRFIVRIFGKIDQTTSYTQKILKFTESHPWCECHHFTSREKIREHMVVASMLAMPSIEENSPMAVIEGMAMGLPVVASRVGGIPELVIDHESGILFDPLDQESIRKAVKNLLDDEKLAQNLSNAAFRKIEVAHFPEQVAKKHIEIYENFLNH